jgi:hypothetical protein
LPRSASAPSGHGVVLLSKPSVASSAGPPSPVLPLAPVPAIVLRIPDESMRRMRRLR